MIFFKLPFNVQKCFIWTGLVIAEMNDIVFRSNNWVYTCRTNPKLKHYYFALKNDDPQDQEQEPEEVRMALESETKTKIMASVKEIEFF
jgi:hypothetical protein